MMRKAFHSREFRAVVCAGLTCLVVVAAPAIATPAAGSTPTASPAGHTAYAWGWNSNGQLGDSTTADRSSPTQIGTETSWTTIDARREHSVALKVDGTLWAWGANDRGQLGTGDTTDRSSPTQIGTATDWSAVSAGDFHTLALKTDGTLWAWGDNGSGQLGNGTFTSRYSPTQVGTAADWKSISTGWLHSMAIKADGTLWAWGNNAWGELGDGTTTYRTSPTQIGTATDWATVSAGSEHTVAIKTDRTMWAWGLNSSGQLGTGDALTTQRLIPTQIGTATDWRAVDAGIHTSVAIKTDGTLWDWGNDSITIAYQTSPLRVGSDTDWAAASAGGQFYAALKIDGSLWSWGVNVNGQLGLGITTFYRAGPTQIGTATDWVAVSSGEAHAVAVRGPAPVASDSWSRTVTSGWGNANVGGAWASGEPFGLAANGSQGTMRVAAAGSSRYQAWLPAISARDVDAVVSVSTDKPATGTYGFLASMQLRRQAVNTEYRARLRYVPGGTVRVAVTKLIGTATETLIGGEETVTGITATSGVPLRMRVQASGASPTTIRVKVWRASGPEPSAWRLTRTDATALIQTAGSVGLTGYLNATASNAPVVFTFDDLTVQGS